MILTYKYRLKGKNSHQVWNYCVQTQRSIQRAWKLGLSPKWPSFYAFKNLAGGVSKEFSIHSQTIQNVCEQFTKSRDLHRKCPRFRHSGGPSGHWWVCFHVEVAGLPQAPDTAVGIDLGLKTLATLSTGETRLIRSKRSRLMIGVVAKSTEDSDG